MLRLNFKSVSPRRELARDEAMLQWADATIENSPQDSLAPMTELLRVWQFSRPTVILGRSSRIDEEVDRAWCAQRGIEVLRRCTGGASVVGGPGCLMYSVVVRIPAQGGLRQIDVAHDFVMQRVLAAVQPQLPAAERAGTCDLIWQSRKFSGNSLRVARHHLLYHGTLLLNADLDLIAECLAFAPRQPEYRRGRNHRDFLCNVGVDPAAFIEVLSQQFGATACSKGLTDVRRAEEHERVIETLADGLLGSRYDDPCWHARR